MKRTHTHTHLLDCNTYKPLTCNPTSAIANDTCNRIEYMHSQHIIDKATKEFLLPLKKYPHNSGNSGPPRIHKPGCPLQSIVSERDGPTDHLSAYVTYFIQLLAATSYHTSKTQNIFSISSKNSHPFHPRPS